MSTLYGPILIVEDVPNVLELLEVTLRFKGYAVLTARNGEEALEVIARQKPVLIITDILMPKLSLPPNQPVAWHIRLGFAHPWAQAVLVPAL